MAPSAFTRHAVLMAPAPIQGRRARKDQGSPEVNGTCHWIQETVTISTDGVSLGRERRCAVAVSHQLAPSTYATFDSTKFSLATGKSQSHVTSFDVTMIVPVASFGLLGQTSVASHTKALWRVGILVAKKNQ